MRGIRTIIDRRPVFLYCLPPGRPRLPWTAGGGWFFSILLKQIRLRRITSPYVVYVEWMEQPTLVIDRSSSEARRGAIQCPTRADAENILATTPLAEWSNPEVFVNKMGGNVVKGPLKLWDGIVVF